MRKNKSISSIATYVNRLYSRSAPVLLGEGILFAIVGIVMLLMPMATLTVLMAIIGICLVLFGLYRAIAGFLMARDIGGGWLDVLFGLLNVIIGVIFCIYPTGSVISIVYVFLALFLFVAVRAVVFAINTVRARFGHYVINLLGALGLVALIVLLMFWPMAGAIASVYFVGVCMLIYAGIDIYIYVQLLKLKRTVGD